MTGVHDPTLLVLAVEAMCAVPSNADAALAIGQHLTMFRRAPECAGFEAGYLGIGAPKHHTDVHATFSSSVEHPEEIAASVRETEIWGDEGDGRPDAVLRFFDGLTNSPECWLAVY